MSVLLLYAHPNSPPSRVNAALRATAEAVDGVQVHDLYETYPHFFIDARREQQLVERHSAVVMQHPMFWYSVPALLKEWLDVTLTRGWAYGAAQTATSGKLWIHAVTTAGTALTYSGTADPARDPTGRANHFALAEFLRPFEQSARLCGMRWRPAFAIHAAERLDDSGLQQACVGYRDFLLALVAEAAEPSVTRSDDRADGSGDDRATGTATAETTRASP